LLNSFRCGDFHAGCLDLREQTGAHAIQCSVL
jgi:hypothetical protein